MHASAAEVADAREGLFVETGQFCQLVLGLEPADGGGRRGDLDVDGSGGLGIDSGAERDTERGGGVGGAAAPGFAEVQGGRGLQARRPVPSGLVAMVVVDGDAGAVAQEEAQLDGEGDAAEREDGEAAAVGRGGGEERLDGAGLLSGGGAPAEAVDIGAEGEGFGGVVAGAEGGSGGGGIDAAGGVFVEDGGPGERVRRVGGGSADP